MTNGLWTGKCWGHPPCLGGPAPRHLGEQVRNRGSIACFGKTRKALVTYINARQQPIGKQEATEKSLIDKTYDDSSGSKQNFSGLDRGLFLCLENLPK